MKQESKKRGSRQEEGILYSYLPMHPDLAGKSGQVQGRGEPAVCSKRRLGRVGEREDGCARNSTRASAARDSPQDVLEDGGEPGADGYDEEKDRRARARRAQRSHSNPKLIWRKHRRSNLGRRNGTSEGNQVHGSASPSDRRPRRRAFFPGPGWALCLCVAFMFYFIFLAPCQHFMSSCKATEERRSMRDPSSIRISRTGAGISLPIRDQESSRYVNHIAATVNPRQPRKATRPIRHEATARRRQQPTISCLFLILFYFSTRDQGQSPPPRTHGRLDRNKASDQCPQRRSDGRP